MTLTSAKIQESLTLAGNMNDADILQGVCLLFLFAEKAYWLGSLGFLIPNGGSGAFCGLP